MFTQDYISGKGQVAFLRMLAAIKVSLLAGRPTIYHM